MSTIKNLPKDNSDRNRTSPVAFTGNKFEFRMLGSSLNASQLNVVINSSMAEALSEMADELEEAKHRQDVREKALAIVAEIYKKHNRILFSGNGYSEDWVKEAKKRGLPNIPTFYESIESFERKDSVKLFTKCGVYTEKEILARTEVKYESFVNIRSIEIKTLTSMVYQNIIPSAIKELNFITTCPKEFMAKSMLTKAKKLSDFIDECSELAGKVEDKVKELSSFDDAKTKGRFILDTIIPLADELRETADKMEHYISKDNLPYPSYEELFFAIDYDK